MTIFGVYDLALVTQNKIKGLISREDYIISRGISTNNPLVIEDHILYFR